MKLGTQVKIIGGMLEFVGSTGVVVDIEKRRGEETLYRVKLDQPVEIPHVGLVTDDLWASRYLKKA